MSEVRIRIDVKGKAIIVYTADQSVDTLAGLFKVFHSDPSANTQFMTVLRGAIHYSPMLQFILGMMGPSSDQMSLATHDQVTAIHEAIRRIVAQYETPDGVSIPCAAWMVSARA